MKYYIGKNARCGCIVAASACIEDNDWQKDAEDFRAQGLVVECIESDNGITIGHSCLEWFPGTQPPPPLFGVGSELSVPVLVLADLGGMLVDDYNFRRGYWSSELEPDADHIVTHWMKLPPPPAAARGEGEECS